MSSERTENNIFRNWVRKNYQDINKSQRQELIRKGFHFCAVFYIIGYYFLARYIVIWFMGILLFLIIVFEFSRLVYPKLNKWWLINFYIQGAYRREEIRKPSVLPFTFGGAFFTMLFFTQRPIVLAALCYQVFGDSMGSIIGQRFGKIRLMKKTLEGSVACFLVCFLIGIVFFSYKIALIGAVTATVVELFFPYDNLFLPIISALVLKYFTF